MSRLFFFACHDERVDIEEVAARQVMLDYSLLMAVDVSPFPPLLRISRLRFPSPASSHASWVFLSCCWVCSSVSESRTLLLFFKAKRVNFRASPLLVGSVRQFTSHSLYSFDDMPMGEYLFHRTNPNVMGEEIVLSPELGCKHSSDCCVNVQGRVL